MDLGEHQPVLSGLLGATVASLLCIAWARWLPKGRNGKDRGLLLLQHKRAVALANWASLAGIGLALALYAWGGYSSSDWRPMGLGAGIALSSPLLVLPTVAYLRGCSPIEAYIAFALAQKTPIFIIYPLLLLGVPLLVFSLIRL
jgi:hypothetical protein